MKATHLYVGHGDNDTISVLIFDNGTEVYFAEDDNAMIIEGGVPEPREYVDGENPDIDKYIGNGSDPTLLYELKQFRMLNCLEEQARIILGL